ncbi:CoA ester lyase [Sphingomonas oleivorans]|uniref:CoA ester lyase n=1 Tax=Sphingomonas oleivorans TaxID=1735121 RepID=A0A2T5FYU8_9SPHN|nr:CoA ester lyase [Sphingomonas oleivorans]PTQ11691.1 CoA ester lyase [Sphingomonas oleivorans]
MQDARPRRSALFLPASNARAIAKARTLPADVLIFDLEDAVAPDAKEAARLNAVEAVRDGGYGDRELVIRVNGLDTRWGEADLAAVAAAGADAVLLPKVNEPEDIAACDAMLDGAGGRMRLWAMIETCAALPRLDAIAATVATTRLGAFVLGTNDLAKEMRAMLTPERTPFLPVLTFAVAAARAHGLAVLDGVCNDFTDIERFRAECAQGRMFGFDGKTLIHPDQIGPCNAIFSPDAEELAWADAVIEAFARPENAGRGAIRVAGRMAELLHLEQARRLRRMAERIAAG